MIPFVDLQAQYRSIKDEIDRAIQGVIDTSAFIRGEPLAAFEKAFAAIHGVKHARGVGSGTDALYLAARACGLGPGDEMITVPNSWVSTATAASVCGATPVFVDIDPDTYQMDADALESAVTPKTKAIFPVHMFGHPAPMTAIMEVATARGIKVVEDVAQAPFAEIAGRRVGTIGDFGCFSFYPSKNLGCFGDGGAVITDDDDLAESVRRLADYGQTERYLHESIGFNSRLDTIQAAVLGAKLKYVEGWTDARRKLAEIFNRRLAGLPVKLPSERQDARAVYHLYVVQVEDRDTCLEHLRANGVMAQVHYPASIHLQPCYAELGHQKGDFPNAERLAEHGLSLPFYPEMTEDQVDQVAETLHKFLER
jgi:dTDP-4-amino-4,6-dideoxygalactose transaminase